MRLVTYADALGMEHAGALIDNGQAVLSLQGAQRELHGAATATSSSVLALIEGCDTALDHARTLVARALRAAVLQRSQVRLRAPIQPPPQMRDCSCFELHLRQAFAPARKLRAQRTPDPEATLAAMNTRADDRVIDTFNRQPIYYKCNRFAVIGADDDVVWPSFSKSLDFELEFGFYIGRKTKDVKKAQARAHIVGYTIFNDISARDAQALEMPGMLGPEEQGLRHRQCDGAVPGDRRRDRRPVQPDDGRAGQRRGMGPRQQQQHALDLRGRDRAHLALRDPVPG